MGRAQGSFDRPEGQAAGHAHRGPPTRVREVRGRHPRGRVRRRAGDLVGRRHLPQPHRARRQGGPERAIRDGHLSIWLEGKKLTGGYALTRVGGGKRARWIMVKEKDERADARRNPLNTQPGSVRSGRTIEEVAAKARPTKSKRQMA